MVSCPQLQFQTQDLPEEGVPVSGEVSFAELDIADEELVRCPNPLRFQLRISPVGHGVLVMGRIRTELVMACDRCLVDVEVPVSAPDVCHHFEDVEGAVVDLTEDIREDILLVFPQTCLCREECLGLCPTCGANLNEGPCSCESASEDESPWGALDGLDLPE
jgi:uncharacterized protein